MQAIWLKELGSKIKAAREAEFLSQAELAQRLHISRTMVSLYETGKNMPAFDIVANMAIVLKTEFVIQGCRISAVDLPKAIPEQFVEQLCLDLDQDYTVTATLVLRPVRGAIHIGGLAKTPKRA